MHKNNQLILHVLLALWFWGCSENPAPSTEGAKEVFSIENVDPLKVTNDTKDLVFRYLGRETGTMELATSIDDVPEEVRGAVIVMNMDPAASSHPRVLYVADLTQAGGDGVYPVRVVDRFAYDASHQEQKGSTTKKSSAPKVQMFSAEWCGVCKQAAQWMRAQNIPFTERDVEKDPRALGDLKAAARRAGMTAQSIGGSVPVFVLGDQVFKGFDANRISAAVKGKK
jgi:glutaredoxin